MKNLKTQAFTLVELIVVITILAILGTIAFISLQSYTRNARDGQRISDINNIRKNLELFYTEKGIYPLPDNGIQMTYSGSLAWTQGTVGDNTIKNLQKLNKKPTDPLTGNEYTYSITNLKTEYQLGAIQEGGTILSLLPQTQAATLKTIGALVVGTYNEKMLKVQSGTTDYILALPSIINADITDVDVQTIINKKNLVYNNYTNLPDSYKNLGYTMTGGFDYAPTANIVVYSGSIQNLKEDTNKLGLIKNLKQVYDNTVLETQETYKDIVNTDTITNTTEAIQLTNSYINNYIGKGIVPIDNTILNQGGTIQASFPTITSNTDLWSLSDNDLKQLFHTGSNNWYTSNWSRSLNNCDLNNITIDSTTFVPGDMGELTLTGNTIYKIQNGTYFLNGVVHDYGHLITGGVCIAMIGESLNGIFFIGNYTSGGVENSYIIESGFNNGIFYNINIDGSINLVNRRGGGIGIYDGNNTLNNIKTYNNFGMNGIALYGGGSNNTLNNIQTYNNGGGIFIFSNNYNLLNNIHSFNNTQYGFQIDDSIKNSLNNIQLYNNYNGFRSMNSASYNFYNNIHTYNNSWENFILGNNSSNNFLNNIKIYNSIYGIDVSSSSMNNKYFGLLKIFNNNTNLHLTNGNDLKLSPGTGSILGLTDGILETTGVMSCSYHSQPNLVGSWGINCQDKGKKITGLTIPVTNYNYGTGIINQTRPVRYNTTITSFELYGTDGIDYNTTKKIGEW